MSVGCLLIIWLHPPPKLYPLYKKVSRTPLNGSDVLNALNIYSREGGMSHNIKLVNRSFDLV